jgi:hypothetical protein
MPLPVNSSTKVITQGLTGSQGTLGAGEAPGCGPQAARR